MTALVTSLASLVWALRRSPDGGAEDGETMIGVLKARMDKNGRLAVTAFTPQADWALSGLSRDADGRVQATPS